MLYGGRERGHYEDLQHAYTVNWAAELGQGTYGKVYVGTKGSATGFQRGFATHLSSPCMIVASIAIHVCGYCHLLAIHCHRYTLTDLVQ